ncbi:chromosome partitioning protein ParA, partial [Methylobacterium sp. J-072]|nr:chromosome partitioning protein ParA [Methylobacterium sp. J-072]
MAIDVRSELRRPITLSFAVVAAVLLVWLLVVTVVHAKHRRAFEQQMSSLQTEQANLQNELAQQRLATGTLSALQAKIATTEQQGRQANQDIEQVQSRLAALRQEQQAAEQKTGEATKEQQTQTQR